MARPDRAQLLRPAFVKKSSYLRLLRMEDFEKIRVWRNQQMEILRQDHEITQEEQRAYAERYLDGLALGTFDQVLFAFIVNRSAQPGMYGYGGFTHIDWNEGSAEISYLVNPRHKEDLADYTATWLLFLRALRLHGRTLGITKWRSETFLNTGDRTRDIHIELLNYIFGAESTTTDESVIQKWEIEG